MKQLISSHTLDHRLNLLTLDVEKWIAQASRAFGALRKSVLDSDLNKLQSILSMHTVCAPVWVRVLLMKNLKKLDSFHNRCVRTIQGVFNKHQWSEHITSLDKSWVIWRQLLEWL